MSASSSWIHRVHKSENALRSWPGLLLAVVLAAQAWAQPPVSPSPKAQRIDGLNSELAAGVFLADQQGRLPGLVAERAGLIRELIAEDPTEALKLALPEAVSSTLRGNNIRDGLESLDAVEGVVEAVVGDDLGHHRSITYWYLHTAADERVEMFFAGPTPPKPGTRVRAQGLRIGHRMAVSRTMRAESLDSPPYGPPSCSTTGARNVAVLMVTTPADPTFPPNFTKAGLQEAFFGSSSDTSDTESLNGFWKEMSYGQTTAVGQVYGPFAVSVNYSDAQFVAAAIQAADSVVDFSTVSHIAIVFPSAIALSYGGFDTIGCVSNTSPSKGSFMASVGWLPAYPFVLGPDPSLYAHELGHGLGLNHSSSDDYGSAALGPLDVTGHLTEYGNPFSVMGSSREVNGDLAGGHYVAQQKSLDLGWLKAGDFEEIMSAGTYTLQPLEAMANPRGLRVLRDAQTSAWLWLEYRQPIGDVDTALQTAYGNLPFNGALVNYEDPNLDYDNHTYLLSFQPVATPNDFTRAAMEPGSTWSDPYSPLTMTVGNPSAGALPITVNYDTPCAALQFSGTTFPAAGGTGTIQVTAPGNCAWSASTGTSWITFQGAASGSGNGTIGFAVAPNSNAQMQSGCITVQRQSTRIVVGGTPMTVLSASPSFGAGASGQFEFLVEHGDDPANTLEVLVTFSGSPDCELLIGPNGGGNNSIVAVQGQAPINLSTPGAVVSNSMCSVSSSGSSITANGNQLWIRLQMNFFAAFAGAHRISASLQDNVASSGWLPYGTWVVPATQPPAVTIQASSPGASFLLESGTTVYQAPITFYWPAGAQHTITWLSSVAGQTGTRYAFQGWADGGPNPRTITAPMGDVTYTANLTAQYLLTVTVLPPAGGAVAASPSSPDGYYASGTNVTLSGTPLAGYYFSAFGGGVYGGSPLSVAMSGPLSVTAWFRDDKCSYSFGGLPGAVGAGQTRGFVVVHSNSGCSYQGTSGSGWLAAGPPLESAGMQIIPYSIAANGGDARTGTLTILGDNGYTLPVQVTQDAAGSTRPSVMSWTPSSGSGSSAVFTFQESNPLGPVNFKERDVYVAGVSGVETCTFSIYPTGPSAASLRLSPDAGLTWLGPLNVPGNGTLQDSSCTLNAANSAVSNADGAFTASIGVEFSSSLIGDNYYVEVYSSDLSEQDNGSPYVGTWTVTAPASPALTIAMSHSGDFLLGQSGAAYSVLVSNGSGAAATTGTVMVTDTPVSTLTVESMSGSGWACSGTSCSRSDGLAGGASYPPITALVKVAPNASAYVTNAAGVSGGGSAAAVAIDPTICLGRSKTGPPRRGRIGSLLAVEGSGEGVPRPE